MNDRLPFQQAEIESSIVDRWNRVVRSFPEETAITTVGGQKYTYQQVDCASDHLADGLLHELGTVNGPVVLLLDHTPKVLIGILGTLKANKAYVALDPTQQPGHLQLLSNTAAAPVIVTDTNQYPLAHAIASQTETIWNIDELPEAGEKHADIRIVPDAVAGIFFTSGTTSQPKGVPRTHRIIMHRTWFNTETGAFGPSHRFSGMFQCGLGGGVSDVFNALLNGAAYCLYSFNEDGLSGLSDWLQAQEITHFNLPIVLFRQWLDMLLPDDYFPHLTQVLPFGRKTHADIDRLWPHVSDACVVLTGYSATETTQVTCTAIDQFTPLEEGTLHAGHPVPDKCVSIVRDDGSPAAAGEEGQIVVRSRYIASSYWRRPELSSQRFKLANDGSGEITYHTGDFGRLRPVGNLELIGRRDSQVKLRGYRVVLSEVEDVIRALPAVKEVFVTVDAARDRLLAYVVATDDPPAPPSAIRSALSKRLPNYILPARFIYLDSFPLLASGKIDQHALPDPDRLRPELETPFLPPRTTLEQELAATWAELLGIDHVGAQDDFFQLGGHSLLTARLLLKTEKRYGVEVSLSDFFHEPTIAHLAKTLESAQATQEERSGQVDAALMIPGDAPEQPQESTVLNSFYDVLNKPPEFVPQSQPSEESTWNWRSRLFNLCLNSMPHLSVSLLSRVTGEARLRTLLFKSKQRRIRKFLDCIDTSVDIESTLASSLYFHLIHRYRIGIRDGQHRTGSQHISRQTQVENLEKLERARELGQGVVLVRSHDFATTWFRPLKLANHRVGGVRHVVQQLRQQSMLDENALFVHQINGARRSLLSGQIVEINGDGYQGTSAGIEHTFHGRRRRFLAGFAELAVMTDAAVLVVDCSLQRPLTACIKLIGPLDGGSRTMPHEERIELLVSQYVQLLHKKWAEEPWMIPFCEIDAHLNAPPIDGSPAENEPI